MNFVFAEFGTTSCGRICERMIACTVVDQIQFAKSCYNEFSLQSTVIFHLKTECLNLHILSLTMCYLSENMIFFPRKASTMRCKWQLVR